MDDIYSNTQNRMDKSIAALKKDLNSVTTGRANTSLLDTVRVESYGNLAPISQLATVSVSDSSTITVQTWDKSMVNPIEKAINNANLGVSTKTEGMVIRVFVPTLTEERRKDLVKLVKKYAEDKKVSIRNERREALDEVKKRKDEFSEDEVKRFSDKVQSLTDSYVKNIDDLVGSKEKEILKI